MDKSPVFRLLEGASALGVDLPQPVAERLWDFASELLKWNARVNLTAITEPLEVVEKHLLDSLAVLPEVEGAAGVLDLGAGAGLPGIPLAIASPKLQVTLVDAVAKKVAFMKNAVARSGLAGRVKAEHVHLGGKPEAERLARAEVVISRAFRDVGPFLQLARHYLAPGGRVVAMVSKVPPEPELGALAQAAGFRVVSQRTWALPFSKAARGVVVFRRLD